MVDRSYSGIVLQGVHSPQKDTKRAIVTTAVISFRHGIDHFLH